MMKELPSQGNNGRKNQQGRLEGEEQFLIRIDLKRWRLEIALDHLYLILQAVTNPMFLSTNSFSIVYTFSWEYISISSHIVVCPLFNITSGH